MAGHQAGKCTAGPRLTQSTFEAVRLRLLDPQRGQLLRSGPLPSSRRDTGLYGKYFTLSVFADEKTSLGVCWFAAAYVVLRKIEEAVTCDGDGTGIIARTHTASACPTLDCVAIISEDLQSLQLIQGISTWTVVQ